MPIQFAPAPYAPTPQNAQIVPDEVKRRLRAAQLLQAAGADTSMPVYTRGLGMAKLGTGLLGGLMEGITERTERDEQAKSWDNFARMLEGKTDTAAAPASSPGILADFLSKFNGPAPAPVSEADGPVAPAGQVNPGVLGDFLAKFGTGENTPISEADGPVRPNIAPVVSTGNQPNVEAKAPQKLANALLGQPSAVEVVKPDEYNRMDAMADRPAPQVAQQPSAPTAFAELFAAKEKEYGLPPGYLQRTAQIESRMDPNAKNPRSTAGGLFQFLDKTAGQYGLQNKFDPNASTDAASRLARDNAAVLRQNLGREPTAAELYLAHQQGATGASKILANPNASVAGLVGNDAAALNGGGGMSGQQFADKWIGKFGQPQAPQGVPMPRSRPDEAPADFNSRFAAINAPMQQPTAYADNAAIPPDARLAQAPPPQFGGGSDVGGMPQQPMQPQPAMQPPQAPQQPQLNMAAVAQALRDPRLPPQMKAMLLQRIQQSQDVKPLDLGNSVAMVDSRGNIVRTIPKEVAPTIVPEGSTAIGRDGKPLFQNGASKPPAGYEWAPNQDGKKVLSPIQGGPATHLPAETGGRLAMMETAAAEFKDARKELEREWGVLDRVNAAIGAGDIGRSQRVVRTAIEAALRAMTGAAAPEQEVARYLNMFMPGQTDTPKTAKQKLDLLENFMGNAKSIITQGRVPAGGSVPQLNAPRATSKPNDPLGIR